MTVVGIDVSKGKSMVAAMKPGGELVTTPYEVKHSDIELSRFALDVLCMEPDTTNQSQLCFTVRVSL